ncbi:hypothetical protein AB6A40_008235 [Gnathostoma spinigerum]|uniref:Matrix-remodeling-associated protein 7 helical domain-containing protein n=1 Tax=Gnathostoma spinigerum TaxID=75299 RepID=A0ABD6EQF7_9BILA
MRHRSQLEVPNDSSSEKLACDVNEDISRFQEKNSKEKLNDESTAIRETGGSCDEECNSYNGLKMPETLHGKLATAELRYKTNKLKREMTIEQVNEEREIREKQLQSIFELMMKDKEKFGFNDKEEILEQMKLYAI